MVTLNDGLPPFTTTEKPGLLSQSLLLSFSEFGRRISENGSRGTDHGSASVMLANGRQRPRRSVRHRAVARPPIRRNPTLENNTADVKYETDFRSAYAKVIDNWLGGDSVGVLGGIFKKSGLEFV